MVVSVLVEHALVEHALVVKELLHMMTEEEEKEEGIAGMFPWALVGLHRLLVVEGEEEEEVVEEVTLLFEDRSQQSVMVVEKEVLILGVLEIFPSQQRRHPVSL